jgi:hypothetical protein
VPTRDALLRSGGDKYWLDSNNCLHLKLTDLGLPWQYTSSFQRDGMYIEEVVSKIFLFYAEWHQVVGPMRVLNLDGPHLRLWG